jgi:hypothetical protein
MRKELTSEDRAKIKRTNLFRFSREWYSIANFVAISTYGYSFFMPYYGWRRKPTHIPENFEEYIEAVLKMHLFILPLLILVVLNFLIKKIEINRNYKNEKNSIVILKRKIWNKKSIIIFKPFHILFFSNTFKYNDVEEGNKVLIETTNLGRLLNYRK